MQASKLFFAGSIALPRRSAHTGRKQSCGVEAPRGIPAHADRHAVPRATLATAVALLSGTSRFGRRRQYPRVTGSCEVAWTRGTARSSMAAPADQRSAENEWYFGEYGQVSTHREMLEDEVRTRAYRKAILQFCPKRIVLDVGCGSGILSLFAAQAGASLVIAVEASSPAADLAREAVRRNGFENRVVVLTGCIEDEAVAAEVDHQLQTRFPAARKPEVDIIVSEWMGYMLVHEDMFPSVAFARDRWLRIGGRMIPSSCSMWAAPFSGYEFTDEVAGFWQSSPYGLDMEHMINPAMKEFCSEPVIDSIVLDSQIAAACQLWHMDCMEMTPEEFREQRLSFNFSAPQTAPLHGLAVWFKCTLAARWGFSCGPEADPTHWAQTLLFVGAGDDATSPTFEGLPVEAGDTISGNLAWKIRGRGILVEVQGVIEHQERVIVTAEATRFSRSFDWTAGKSAK